MLGKAVHICTISIIPHIAYVRDMSLDNGTDVSCAEQFPQDQYKIIATVRVAIGPVSIVLAALAILINVLYKKYLFQFHLIVLYMSVGTVVRGFTASLSLVDYVVQNEATKAICVTLGFVDRYSLWIILLSSLSLAYSLFADFGVSNGVYGDKQRHGWFWFSFIFVFPLSFVWVPFINLAYGRPPNYPWCTIRTLDEKCDTFEFGVVVSMALLVIAVFVSSLVILMYVATGVILIRRQRRWKRDPDSVKINRYQNRCWFVFLLPMSAFIAALVLGVARAVSQSNNTFAIDIIDAAYNPTAIIVFLFTVVDRELCRRPLLGRFTFKSKVEVYNLKSVREEEITDTNYYAA